MNDRLEEMNDILENLPNGNNDLRTRWQEFKQGYKSS